MNMKLQERCNLQIENEAIIRKAGFLQYEELIKLGALFYTTRGLKAEGEKIKACKKMLKSSAGIFSNFRGFLEYIIVVKMSLAEDPQAYINQVIDIYKKLVEGRKLPGETLAMAAITIYEQSKGKDVDSIIKKTREAYAQIKQDHRFLTDETDMSFVALMAITGMDTEKAATEVEEIFQSLKDNYRIPSNSAQATALVLSMSPLPVQEKVDKFLNIYKVLREEQHATSKGKSMSIYAAFADLDIPQERIIPEIIETDLWLKKQKGYGVLSINADVRRVLAATMVLKDHEAERAALSTDMTSVVSAVVAEEVIFAITMIIVMSMVIYNMIN